MITVPAWPSHGYDTAGSDAHPGHVCTPEWLAQLPPEIEFLARYLPASGVPLDQPDSHGGDFGGCWSSSHAELGWILDSGRAFMPFMWGPRVGDQLGHALGLERGRRAGEACQALGIPEGCHAWIDLEGRRALAAGRSGCLDYVNGAARGLLEHGMRAGCYDGSDLDLVPLTGWDLYHGLPDVTSYWGSVPAQRDTRCLPVRRGWGVSQSLGRRVGQLFCDPDEVVTDGIGCLPWWVVAG